MRLAVDARILHAPSAGSAYYTRGWLGALSEVDFAGELLLIGPAPTAEMLGDGLPAEDVVVEGIDLCDERWEQTGLPCLLEERGPDAFISPTSTLPMLRCCPQVTVVYDLGFETHPQFYAGPLRAYLRRWVPKSCRVADAVVTLSEFGRDELTRIYGIEPAEISICPGAAGERFSPADSRADLRAIREKYGIRGRVVLSVCGLERNKNLPRLLEAFAQATGQTEEEWTLVLTGRAGGAAQQIQQMISQLGIADRVVLTGFVPDEDLPLLYCCAEVFAFVSLYEGFGLPPLEAMACGTAVLASNAASVPEVVGDAGVLVDPEDVDAIARGLVELMGSIRRRRELAEAGRRRAGRFTWAATAERILEVCRRAACAS